MVSDLGECERSDDGINAGADRKWSKLMRISNKVKRVPDDKEGDGNAT